MHQHVILKVGASRKFKSENRQITVEISLIRSTSKLAPGTHFDHPNEKPGAYAELSLINQNLGVYLSVVPIKNHCGVKICTLRFR